MSNSLREYDSLTDRLRFHVRGDQRAILLVEGPTDELLLKDFVPAASIFIAGSRSLVLKTSQELHDIGRCGFVAVYDEDFDPAPPPFESDLDRHLHPYEGRDLEEMLIRLGGWNKLVELRGSRAKLERAGGAFTALEKVLDIVRPISRLRMENARRQLGLPFDSIKLSGKIDRKTMELKLVPYCSALLSKCSTDVTVGDLVKISNSATDITPRGKDVLEVTSSALRGWIGSLDTNLADADLLAEELVGFSHHFVYSSGWLGELTRRLRLGNHYMCRLPKFEAQ